jgi:AraC family transcriptional regulator
MSPAESPRITVEQQQHIVSGVPAAWTQGNVYALNMPTSHGAVRAARNGKVFFEGELRPGMMRIACPGEYAETTVLASIRYVKLSLPAEFLRRTFFDAGLRWPTTPAQFAALTQPNLAIGRLANSFALAPSLGPDWRQPYIDGLTQALLTTLISNSQLRFPRDNRLRNAPLNDEQFLHCCVFTDEMMGKKLSLDQWAATLGMEAAEFSRRFRRRTKQSPYSWFLSRRIEHTKRLLQEQKMSLSEIAKHAGFCSQSHFTDVFRQRVGCSPVRWAALPSSAPDNGEPER